jgi:hypothetical protein
VIFSREDSLPGRLDFADPRQAILLMPASQQHMVAMCRRRRLRHRRSRDSTVLLFATILGDKEPFALVTSGDHHPYHCRLPAIERFAASSGETRFQPYPGSSSVHSTGCG